MSIQKYSNLTGYEKRLSDYTIRELYALASKYKIARYKTYSKNELIRQLKINQNFISANPKFKQTSTTTRKNRIKPILYLLDGTETPDELMNDIMSALNKEVTIPTPGKYYTFIYNAKTPNIIYDQYPLIGALQVKDWGFIGFNYHWPEYRQYTWEEVSSPILEVYSFEIDDLKRIPYAKMINK